MINLVVLAGNLVAEPELNYTPQSVAICNFTLAINRKYKSNEEWKEDVSFISVTAIGKLAELCKQRLTKGSKCLVEGKIRQERWIDTKGKQQSKTKVVADNVQFFTYKKLEKTQEGQDDGREDYAEYRKKGKERQDDGEDYFGYYKGEQ